MVNALHVERCAERELHAVAVGRTDYTFAGSNEGGRRASAI